MRDYTVENPVFSDKIRIVEEEDLVNAENDSAAAKQLIQNDLALSKRMKQCLGDAPEHGDSKDLVVTFASGDEQPANEWTDVPVIQSVEDHKTIFTKMSTMVKNVRYLYKLLGTTDISGCGADTVTGAIKKLSERKIPNVTRSASVTQEGQQALDAVEKNAAVSGTMAYDLAQINSKISDDCYLLSGGRGIKEHTDLNSIQAPGNYFCSLNGTAATLSNCPTDNAFVLKVELATGVNYPCQTLRIFHTGQTLYRFLDGATWGHWHTTPIQVIT